MIKSRTAVAGIHIESSTFTPYISTVDDSIVTHGEELMDRFYWRDEDWVTQIEWIPVLHSRALPGGVVECGAYDAWKAEILEGLAAAGPFDGLFSDIHGAISVQGMGDAEGDPINAIHGVIGPDPMVSTSMDLRRNVFQDLFNGCDILTCYRLVPHEDVLEPHRRAAYNLGMRLLNGQPKPVKALVHVPVLPPGEKTSTRIEPVKSPYKMVDPIEAMDGILDAAIWIGFTWTDQPRCKGAVVVTDDDAGLAKGQTERIDQYPWDVHDRFEFVAPVASMEECLAVAEEGPKPFFISDSGDNPGAGDVGDVTVALVTLLARKPVQEATPDAIYASIIDPVAAAVAWEAGVDAEVDLEVGGYTDIREPGLPNVHATVEALVDDPMGDHTALLCTGGLRFIITTNRNQYTTYSQFELLGVDITTADVVVVKIGHLEPDLYETQKGQFMALIPGGVDQDLVRLSHHKIEHPMFPFDLDMVDLNLSTQVVVP